MGIFVNVIPAIHCNKKPPNTGGFFIFIPIGASEESSFVKVKVKKNLVSIKKRGFLFLNTSYFVFCTLNYPKATLLNPVTVNPPSTDFT